MPPATIAMSSTVRTVTCSPNETKMRRDSGFAAGVTSDRGALLGGTVMGGVVTGLAGGVVRNGNAGAHLRASRRCEGPTAQHPQKRPMFPPRQLTAGLRAGAL